MGLLSAFKNIGDPTKDWPVVAGPTPAVHRRTLQLEAPRFGEPVDSARLLGRPDVFEWTSRKDSDCELHD